MLDLRDVLWAGTDASYRAAVEIDEYLSAEAKVGGGLDVRASGAAPASEADAGPYLLQKQGNVGVINIKGPMVNTDNWMTQMFGMATYPAIREALIAAAQDPSIEQILLNIDSGGGSVSGCADTANLVSRINAGAKPVTAFADGSICSAAYWLGSSAGEVLVSNTAVAGSIGVIAMHVEYTKQMAQDGVTATVVRAGKYKALANPMEVLSAAGKDEIQSQVDAMYGIFLQHVADARGVPAGTADKQMGQGRTFVGKSAVDANVADGVSSYDAVMSGLMAKKAVDKAKPIYDNGIHNKRSTAMPKALTDQEIAALASGAAAGAVVAPTEAEAAAFAAARAEAEAEAATRATTTVAVAATTVAAEASNDLVTFLTAQVKEKDAQILAAAIETKEIKAQLAGIEATHATLTDLARASIGKMQVALGGSASDFAALTDVQVLAEHARVAADFTKKFKVGGVAITAPAQETRGEAAAADSLQHARIAATKQAK